MVEPACDVEAQRPYRRFPAHADAHAGMPVRFGAVEGAAAVDEHRAAPALREVALELDAGGDHVLGTDREVADARADLAPLVAADAAVAAGVEAQGWRHRGQRVGRSEEHTSELQSLMRISYAVFCLKKKKLTHIRT